MTAHKSITDILMKKNYNVFHSVSLLWWNPNREVPKFPSWGDFEEGASFSFVLPLLHRGLEFLSLVSGDCFFNRLSSDFLDPWSSKEGGLVEF